MKIILSFLFLLAVCARADILVTNVVPIATYSATTNVSSTFVAPQSHSVSPLTVRLYHSETNIAFPTTNLYQVTFDGGQTWANVATYVASTNTQNEVWTMSQGTLTASNRILVLTRTNQTLLLDASWSR